MSVNLSSLGRMIGNLASSCKSEFSNPPLQTKIPSNIPKLSFCFLKLAFSFGVFCASFIHSIYAPSISLTLRPFTSLSFPIHFSLTFLTNLSTQAVTLNNIFSLLNLLISITLLSLLSSTATVLKTAIFLRLYLWNFPV